MRIRERERERENNAYKRRKTGTEKEASQKETREKGRDSRAAAMPMDVGRTGDGPMRKIT